jgi:hypothetical protein
MMGLPPAACGARSGCAAAGSRCQAPSSPRSLRLDATIITENAKDFRLDSVRAVSLAEL